MRILLWETMVQLLCCLLQVEVTQLSLNSSSVILSFPSRVPGSCDLLELASHPSRATHHVLCDLGDARTSLSWFYPLDRESMKSLCAD